MSNRIFYDYLPGAILYVLDFNSFLTVAVVVTFLMEFAIFRMQLYKTNLLEKKTAEKEEIETKILQQTILILLKNKKKLYSLKKRVNLKIVFWQIQVFL